MRKLKVLFIQLALLLPGTTYLYSQGCSDAGFCTINSFKPDNTDSTVQLNNQFKVGAFFGTADNAIKVYGTYLEYYRQLGKRFGIDAKLTTLVQQGNGITALGLSDIFINSNYAIRERLKFTLGMKIPLSNANKSENNLPLPMDYQSSLGTFDVVFGIGYEIKKFHFVAAIQQPLTQNDNRFIAANYPIDSELRTFQSTNGYVRSGDVLLRVSYPFKILPKLKLTPSILPIYHLANDRYTDEFNVEREIQGSRGLTLNGNVFLDYEMNSKHSLQLNMGMPFLVREARPDGLTRGFIVNFEYRFRF